MTDPWRKRVEIGDAVLYLGDALETIPALGRFDVVVTDPPYIIGAISVGNSKSKSGTWADMLNASYWFSAWMRECRNKMPTTGFLACCGNWRSVPTLIYALSQCQWAATSCVIWDKQWIGPAYTNAFRTTYELAMVAALPDAVIKNRSASDVFRGRQWQAGTCRTTEHPAEKPVDFMQYLVEALAPEGGTVFDPFMGSATTALACLASGRKFIGVEVDERYFNIAVERITAAHAQGRLFK